MNKPAGIWKKDNPHTVISLIYSSPFLSSRLFTCQVATVQQSKKQIADNHNLLTLRWQYPNLRHWHPTVIDLIIWPQKAYFLSSLVPVTFHWIVEYMQGKNYLNESVFICTPLLGQLMGNRMGISHTCQISRPNRVASDTIVIALS